MFTTCVANSGVDELVLAFLIATAAGIGSIIFGVVLSLLVAAPVIVLALGALLIVLTALLFGSIIWSIVGPGVLWVFEWVLVFMIFLALWVKYIARAVLIIGIGYTVIVGFFIGLSSGPSIPGGMWTALKQYGMLLHYPFTLIG